MTSFGVMELRYLPLTTGKAGNLRGSTLRWYLEWAEDWFASTGKIDSAPRYIYLVYREDDPGLARLFHRRAHTTWDKVCPPDEHFLEIYLLQPSFLQFGQAISIFGSAISYALRCPKLPKAFFRSNNKRSNKRLIR